MVLLVVVVVVVVGGAVVMVELLFPTFAPFPVRRANLDRGTIAVDTPRSYHCPDDRQDEMRAIPTEQRPWSYDERVGYRSRIDARCMHVSARSLPRMIV